jgi:flagellar P-ring protein FlgI
MSRTTFALALLGTILLQGTSRAAEVRIKDITDVQGARSNQLYGFGLVMGLAGTGSRSLFTLQVISDMLQRLHQRGSIFQNTPADAILTSTTVSAVMVTGEIGPYSRAGSTIDVNVSCLDDAISLQGGVLIMTPLHGADGDIYATAQGPLSIGGFAFAGAAASVQKNHPTAGVIVNHTFVEKEAPGQVICNGKLNLLLRRPDYSTVCMIAKVINERFPCAATAVDAACVRVTVPPEYCDKPMPFISEIGLLTVTPDINARVVINERTGTVVAGEHVKISAASVAHGSLSIVRQETPEVSQPEPFSNGKTVVVPRTNLNVTEQRSRLVVVPESLTVEELARALNALGVTPRDLIAIFQALEQAGALHAELIIM